MKLTKKKILVTGADGFIGSHLVEGLVRHGADVRAFVQYNSFNSYGWLDKIPLDIRSNLEIILGDIRDSYGVRNAVQGCDAIMHLAALVAIPYSYNSPESYVETNIKGTLNILQAARDMKIERLVHTSTSEVYGTARYIPIDENHPLTGQSPYSASKIAADQLAISFYKSFNVPVAILRPFNTYGPRQSARALVPSIIIQLARGSKTLRLGSTSPTRDFTYVTDTVDAFIAIAECDEAVGEIVNAGSEYEISVAKTAEIIAEEYGIEIDIKVDEQRKRPEKSEVERLYASAEKMKRLTGWTPVHKGVNGFREGIKKTILWFGMEENLNKYKASEYNI